MKKSWKPVHLIAIGFILCLTVPASATRLIPFQGRVTDAAGQPLEGVFRVTFTIYDEATGGTALYAESHENVSVIGGQINVLLGSLASLDDPDGNPNTDDAVRFDEALKPRFLGIKVGTGPSPQEMVPRHQLVPSFHARSADIAGTTADGGVGTDQLADGAVTFDKLSADALEAIIPPGSIMPYGGITAPPGWVLCDGAQYDSGDPAFAKVFAAIGNSFGGTDPLFNVPDLRGQFLRGVDAGRGADPDAAQRVGGDVVGSTQGSAIVGLAGSTSTNGSHAHAEFYSQVLGCPGGQDCAIGTGGGGSATLPIGYFPSNFANIFPYFPPVAGDHAHSVFVSPTSGATSSETRPKNVAVNYIIKL